MSIRLMSIKNITNQNKKLSVNLMATRRFPSREMAQNTQRFRQSRSNDGQCPTTDSPSISYASVDHREDSIQQNSNQLSGRLKTLIMCQFGSPTEPNSKSTLCIVLRFTVPKLYIIIFPPFKYHHQQSFYRKVSVRVKIQVRSWCQIGSN